MCTLTVKSLVNTVVLKSLMKCTLDVVWIYTRLNIFFQISAELDLMYLVIFHDWFDNKKKR